MEAEGTLLYAVRWPVLGRYLGQLALVLALPPLGVSLFYGEFPISLRYLAIIALLLVAGWPLCRLQAPDRIQGNEAMIHALLIIALFGAVVALSWLAFLAHGSPALDALFEVVSAVGTVGLSSGITRSALPAFLKLVLCFDMLTGRLEIVALLVALYPVTWIGKMQKA